MTIASPTENPVENKLGPAKALPHTGKAAGRTRWGNRLRQRAERAALACAGAMATGNCLLPGRASL